MSKPTSINATDKPHIVQAGLTVRTAIHVGESNVLKNVETTLSGWWDNLRNAFTPAKTVTTKTTEIH